MERKQIDRKNIGLIDSFGREHNYLRLSLTDRCNLRCSYCMPAHPVFMPNEKILSQQEIQNLASTFVNLGINKIRLTGGEPLSRKDFPEIVRGLSKLPVSLRLTTNGYFANEHIDLLRNHFASINVSLDTLKKERFRQITQRDAFSRTLQNIDLLMEYGIRTKLNVVVVRNVNDDEIVDFVKLTLQHPIEVRFIEFMPFQGNRWKLAETFPQAEILSRIGEKFNLTAIGKEKNQTSQNFKIEGSQSSFGIISTVSNPFCHDCNRIRITADGKIKNCLFSSEEEDLRAHINNPKMLESHIRSVIRQKHYSYGGKTPMNNKHTGDAYSQNRSMTAIGG